MFSHLIYKYDNVVFVVLLLFYIVSCCYIFSLVFYVVVFSIMYKKRYFLNRLRTTNHACIITVGTKP